MSDIWYKVLESGALKYNRLPGKIKIWKLEKYLTREKHYETICNEIKYSVNTPTNLRNSSLWYLIKNSFPINYDFSKICAFKSYSFKNNLESIIIIDFSILFSKKKKEIKAKFPKFYNKLILVLKDL